MFHWFGTATNTRGDALPGWQVECVNVDTTDVVAIYADEGSTPIETISGVTNRATADEDGNYDFYVPSGTYSLRFYNAQGVFRKTIRYLPMYGEDLALGAAVRTVTGTSYTLTADDENAVLLFTSNSPITVTLPSKFDANITTGAFVEFHQRGSGAITFAPGSGVTTVSRVGLTTAGSGAIAGGRKTGNSEWALTGDLA